MARFTTTAAYLSGGICGSLWMSGLAGTCINKNLRPVINRFSETARVTFDEMLEHILMENGGDFQNPQFTADTVIRIGRRRVEGPGKYSVHVKEIEVAELLPAMVNDECYASDFFGDD